MIEPESVMNHHYQDRVNFHHVARNRGTSDVIAELPIRPFIPEDGEWFSTSQTRWHSEGKVCSTFPSDGLSPSVIPQMIQCVCPHRQRCIPQ